MPEANKIVSVGCKLPHGLICELKTQGGEIERVTLAGANAARIVGGYGITENISGEFMERWLKKNARHLAVINGSIFIHNDVKGAEGTAKERREVPTGLEPIDPIKNGMLRNGSGANDPAALASYEKLKLENPDRNRQRVE